MRLDVCSVHALIVPVGGTFAVACAAEAPDEPTGTTEAKLDSREEAAYADTAAPAAETDYALCSDYYDKGANAGLTTCKVDGKKYAEVSDCKKGTESVSSCCRRHGLGTTDALVNKKCPAAVK